MGVRDISSSSFYKNKILQRCNTKQIDVQTNKVGLLQFLKTVIILENKKKENTENTFGF